MGLEQVLCATASPKGTYPAGSGGNILAESSGLTRLHLRAPLRAQTSPGSRDLVSWKDQKCTHSGTAPTGCGRAPGCALGATIRDWGGQEVWRIGPEQDLGRRSGKKEASAGWRPGPGLTGREPGLTRGRRQAWEQRAGANATSDICAVLLTLGWRGQEESEFCPVDARGVIRPRCSCCSYSGVGVLKPSLPLHERPFTLYFQCAILSLGCPSTVHF